MSQQALTGDDRPDRGTADRDLLTTAEVAKRLGIAPQTLNRLKSAGDGPAHIRISERKRRFRWSTVEKWLESREADA